MRFDFTGDLLIEMKEYERAVLTFLDVSGETVSSALKVEMVLNRLGDSELASRLVTNSKRLKETELNNITRATGIGRRS